MKSKISIMALALSIMPVMSYAQEVSPYMGGDVKLTEAPNGAVVRISTPFVELFTDHL